MTSFKLHPTTSNKSQRHATTHNMVCKRSQHVGPNNVASCWPTMLRAFARAFINVADSDIYITAFLTCLTIYIIFYLENYRLRKLKYHCLLITALTFCGSETEIEQTSRKPHQIFTNNISNRETLILFL